MLLKRQLITGVYPLTTMKDRSNSAATAVCMTLDPIKSTQRHGPFWGVTCDIGVEKIMTWDMSISIDRVTFKHFLNSTGRH